MDTASNSVFPLEGFFMLRRSFRNRRKQKKNRKKRKRRKSLK
jgi:hypothetical protein